MASKKTSKTSQRSPPTPMKLYTPDKKLSKNIPDYLKPWIRMQEELTRILNVQHIGFDPGFLVYDPLTERTANIPTWLAEKIIESVKGK